MTSFELHGKPNYIKQEAWDPVNFKWLLKHPLSGCDTTPVHLSGASELLCGASRSPWQLACRASKADSKNLHIYWLHTTIFWAYQSKMIAFCRTNKGEIAHIRKKSGQVRINSRQVDLSRSLPQGQAEDFFFIEPCLWARTAIPDKRPQPFHLEYPPSLGLQALYFI